VRLPLCERHLADATVCIERDAQAAGAPATVLATERLAGSRFLPSTELSYYGTGQLTWAGRRSPPTSSA
jgi:hypothetical protein